MTEELSPFWGAAEDSALATAAVRIAMQAYWDGFITRSGFRERASRLGLDEPRSLASFLSHDPEVPARSEKHLRHAELVGRTLAAEDPLAAGFRIGSFYTSLLPRQVRSAYGIYYTPLTLAERLIDMAEEAGTDWSRARVIDPACGGGAFVAPVAQRIIDAHPKEDCARMLGHLSSHLRGYEIDPLGAWLSQVIFDAVVLENCIRAGERPPRIIDVRDSLSDLPAVGRFDLVIGNPPYGKVKLDPARRSFYGRSLFGHANLYGLFTHQALRMTRHGGVIAFITPTSFLSGEYFKNLRLLLSREARPSAVDFVHSRTAVFEDVLQETVLATYRRGDHSSSRKTHVLDISSDGEIAAFPTGTFTLPSDGSAPWIMARTTDTEGLVRKILKMPHRLSDYGYSVKTGPLVWNRHKKQLRPRPGENHYPLIWAEAVGPDGTFAHRATKKNHTLYFEIRGRVDEWLLTREQCVLLQRTTAKEQPRRLIAATMPEEFIDEHGPVVIENHLNVLRPTGRTATVSPGALAALLNSSIVDRAFRCINGSVAVSAYELNALPLPGPHAIAELERMIHIDARTCDIDALIEQIYLGNEPSAILPLEENSAAA